MKTGESVRVTIDNRVHVRVRVPVNVTTSNIVGGNELWSVTRDMVLKKVIDPASRVYFNLVDNQSLT